MFKNGQPIASKSHACLFILSLMLSSVGGANAASIDVGSHLLQPDTPNQPIVIAIVPGAGDPTTRGINLRAQIGDGNGAGVEPVFQGTLGTLEGLDLTGSIWGDLVGGSTVSGNGVPRTGFGSLGSADLTSNNPSENVAADGKLLTLLIDTTGFSAPGTFDLNLSETALGNTSLIADDGRPLAPLDITNGLIKIVEEVPGDFNGNGMLDSEDIEMLAAAIRQMSVDEKFDIDEDGQVSLGDHTQWVRAPNFAGTYFGDSNVDGEFNSADLVLAFTPGEYEDTVALNSSWAEGDWNGDGDFDSADLIEAFQDGGFEQGPRPAASAVPEPSSSFVLIVGIVFLACRRFRS